MNKNQIKKKKKGFTLVEVIIVLAIIAIIAAIAIPNLTKVRTESKIKADTQSCETIRRTMLTLITEDSIKVDTANKVEISVTITGGKISAITVPAANLSAGVDADYITGYFENIKAPQADGATNYAIEIDTDGEVYAAAINENDSDSVVVGELAP